MICLTSTLSILSNTPNRIEAATGNPYTKYLKKLGRDKVIEMYRDYIMNKPELLRLIPIELKDKVLGCWCKPEKCHGDILAEIAHN